MGKINRFHLSLSLKLRLVLLSLLSLAVCSQTSKSMPVRDLIFYFNHRYKTSDRLELMKKCCFQFIKVILSSYNKRNKEKKKE